MWENKNCVGNKCSLTVHIVDYGLATLFIKLPHLILSLPLHYLYWPATGKLNMASMKSMAGLWRPHLFYISLLLQFDSEVGCHEPGVWQYRKIGTEELHGLVQHLQAKQLLLTLTRWTVSLLQRMYYSSTCFACIIGIRQCYVCTP